MTIQNDCLKYFQEIDIDFDLYIIADIQKKTASSSSYIIHADDSEFFPEKNLQKLHLHFFI